MKIKRLLKRLFIGLLLLVVVGYGTFALFYFSRLPNEGKCGEIVVTLMNGGKDLLITETQVRATVTSSAANPVGKLLSEINTEAIEELLEKNRIIKDAIVYQTNSGRVLIKVYQRIPLYKIMGENGNFWVDTEGIIMPMQGNFITKTPIASGTIEKTFAANELRNFVVYLQEHELWNEQIEQIYVFPNQEVELIPLVGDHRILLGTLTDVDKKMNRLMKFYRKGLNKVGWNRYSVINLKYDKQVVCTKR